MRDCPDNQFDYIGLIFKEMASFSEEAGKVLSDFEYAKLQKDLRMNPEAGDLIRETGGARKIRVALPGVGKRGGARVVYYYHCKTEQTVHLLLLYRKNVQGNLTQAQIGWIRWAIGLIKEGKL